MEDHPDLLEVQHRPTRGDRAIDRSLVNFGRAIEEASTLPPLETEEGRESDHKVAWAEAYFVSPPEKVVKYKYRAYTESGADSFLRDLNSQDWQRVYDADGTDKKTEVFQDIVDSLLVKNFKWKTTTRRESEAPWINETGLTEET